MLYAAVLVVLLPVQSLWLDELIELLATRSHSISEVIRGYATHSAGQSPLGAVQQTFVLQLIGYSKTAARLPAAAASVLAVLGICILAKQAGVRHVWWCAVLFATFPLQLRYATEARPYSQALCVAVWLTVLSLKFLSEQKLIWTLTYGLLLTIGLYTQPYVLFVVAAHICALGISNRGAGWKLMLAATASVALYLPWYFAARANWRQEINVEQLHFHLQAKLPLLIAREVIGSGYAGTALVLFLAILAFRFAEGLPEARRVLLFSGVLPIVLAVATDYKFDYFFAIRQIITVLPAASVLATLGLEGLSRRKGARVAYIAGIMLAVLDSAYVVRWFTKPREDWAASAAAITARLQNRGCLITLPPETDKYYAFFRPELAHEKCDGSHPDGDVVAIAVSPYLRNEASLESTVTQLRTAGYVLEQVSGLPQVWTFRTR